MLLSTKIKDVNTAISKATNFYLKRSIEESIIVVSIIYLSRYYEVVKEISSKNLTDIFKACSSLAYKFLLDGNVITDYNFYENEICKKIKWNLFIDETVYKNFASTLFRL